MMTSDAEFWPLVKLRDLGELMSGSSPASTQVNSIGRGTPYLGGAGDFDADGVATIAKWTTASVRVAPAESVLIVMKGSVGKVFPGVQAALGRDLAAFIPHRPLHVPFLLLVIEKVCQALVSSARGQIPGLSRSQILDVEVPLPTIEKQVSIAETAHAAKRDLLEVLTSLADAASQLDDALTAAYRSAFDGAMSAEWRRAEGLIGLEAAGGPALRLGYLDEDDDVPPGWRWVRLGDIAEMKTGHTPNRRRPEYWGGEIPWLSIPDARDHDGRTIEATTQGISDDGLRNSSAELLPVGTVCLVRTAASIGYVTVMGRPMATSQDFINWVCGPEIVPQWLMSLLLGERQTVIGFGRGSVHKTVYMDVARQFYVRVPPLTEQEHVLLELNATVTSIDAARADLLESQVGSRSAIGGVLEAGLARFKPQAGDLGQVDALLSSLDATSQVRRVAVTSEEEALAVRSVERLVETVRSAGPVLSPEELFARGGYDSDAIDEFYAHLRLAIESKSIRYDPTLEMIVAA